MKSKFIPVSGLEILDQIYDKEHNDFELEEVIEDVYKMMTYKASNMQVMTVKKGFYKSREKTDFASRRKWHLQSRGAYDRI